MSEGYDHTIIHSLRKSKNRRAVLNYLVKIYPKKAYASEIARRTGVRLNEVCGALKGSPNRYKKKYSLVELDLVRLEEENGRSLYFATELGHEVYRHMFKQKKQ